MRKMTGKIIAISISGKRGEMKKNVEEAILLENLGIEGDAHAVGGNRQVSLLAEESIDKMRAQGANVSAGNFAENITTEGIELITLSPGTRFKLGREGAVLELTQIGKECHGDRCSVYAQVGDCVMPREGVFARVVSGGVIRPGDEIIVLS